MNRTKRITILDLWGTSGPVQYSSQLANALNQLPDYEVTVILPYGGEIELFDATIPIIFVPAINGKSIKDFFLLPVYLLLLPLFLYKLKSSKPDLIHINHCHVWYFGVLPFLRKKWPIITTMHDIDPHPGKDDTWRKRQEIAYLIRKADHIFVHGLLLRKKLLSKYPDKDPQTIHSIPHGDYHFFREYASDLSLSYEDILFFGRIRAYKGLDVLLKAIPMVWEKFPEEKFVIAGDGDFKPYQALMHNDQRLSTHIRYLSEVEVAGFFQRAKMLVMPYKEASQSGVIPVAYAFRKPVIASTVGSIPEVMEHLHTGLLIPPKDEEALAKAIIYLLEHPEEGKVFGENGHQFAKQYLSWTHVAELTSKVYQEIT